MGCTPLKGFISFSKIKTTENQHEIGTHNLGQAQASTTMPSSPYSDWDQIHRFLPWCILVLLL